MNPPHDRSTARMGRSTAGFALTLTLLLSAVVACGGRTAAESASDELNAGLAADAVGQSDVAAARYRACLAFEPTNKYCIFNLGVHAQNAGRALEAENNYRLALLQDLDFAPALYNLAILRREAGSTDEAIALYRHLLEVEPDHGSGHFNLGMALIAIGETEGGMAELAEGVRLNPALVIPSPLPSPEGSSTARPSPTSASPNEASPGPS